MPKQKPQSSSKALLWHEPYRKIPIYCDEYKDVTDKILTMYTEV